LTCFNSSMPRQPGSCEHDREWWVMHHAFARLSKWLLEKLTGKIPSNLLFPPAALTISRSKYIRGRSASCFKGALKNRLRRTFQPASLTLTSRDQSCEGGFYDSAVSSRTDASNGISRALSPGHPTHPGSPTEFFSYHSRSCPMLDRAPQWPLRGKPCRLKRSHE
jgi:hypothetical protein